MGAAPLFAFEAAVGSGGVQGTQSVRRAIELLQLVAAQGDAGARLSPLVEASGLDRGTAHRLLSCLVEQQFVDRDEQRVYRLGPAALLLASPLTRPVPLLQRFGPMMKRLARRTRDTVFLMVREGDHVHCVHREDGPAPLCQLTTEVGQRRLLGTGTGGVAMLGYLGRDELLALHQRHAAQYAAMDLDAKRLLKEAEQARRNAHAFTTSNLEAGVGGVGVAFRIARVGIGAVSIASLASTLTPQRHEALATLIGDELRQLEVETATGGEAWSCALTPEQAVRKVVR
ncbi:IclR family transcriptional regulator [Aquincola sp. MAHUQ-54]|uniref:IclR family transcriptional regulator n=1 Tax=Aquincola agrisoli TaxID=3119538 RepID=A0AAW9QF90_9BURK